MPIAQAFCKGKYKLIVLVTFLFCALQSNAQFGFTLTDFTITSGVSVMPWGEGFQNDFKILAQDSETLNKEFIGYDPSSRFFNYEIMGRHNAYLTFALTNKAERKVYDLVKVDLGFTINSAKPLSWRSSRYIRSKIDFLSSETSGRTLNIDSATTGTLTKRFSTILIGPYLGLNISTDPNKLFMAYAGFGVTYGITVNSRTQIKHHVHWSFEEWTNSGFQRDDYRNEIPQYSLEYANETFRNRTGFGWSSHFFGGISVRLSMDDKVLKNMQLMGELIFNQDVLYIPDLASNRVANLLGVRVGFRYRLYE
jgi:hypothetical protein